MTKFSIRDMLLLTLIIGLTIGWWAHVRRVQSEVQSLQQRLLRVEQNQQLQKTLDEVRQSAIEEKLERYRKEPRAVEIRPLTTAKLDREARKAVINR